MQLGFVSAIVPDLDLIEVMDLAVDEGFACVELMCWPRGRAERKFAGVTHVDVNELTSARADDIRALAADRGVEISALGYYPNILDGDRAAGARCANHLLKVIDAAAALQIATVNTFIGADHRADIDTNLDRFAEVWPPLIAHAEDKGIRIGIENCPMLFTADEWPSGKNLARSPAVWRRMFETIDSDSLGLNYDPSHLVWQAMDWLAPLHEFRDKLFHVHAKDVRMDAAALDALGILATPLEYHRPRVPGFGEIDWGRFIGTLAEVGYDGPVCIEVEDDTFGKTLEGRRRALRVARDVLRPFIGS